MTSERAKMYRTAYTKIDTSIFAKATIVAVKFLRKMEGYAIFKCTLEDKFQILSEADLQNFCF
jgi:hypothetical protein